MNSTSIKTYFIRGSIFSVILLLITLLGLRIANKNSVNKNSIFDNEIIALEECGKIPTSVLEEAAEKFFSDVYSDPSMIEQAKLLNELEEVEERFFGATTKEKKKLSAGKAAGILHRIGMSDEVQISKKNRIGFILFVQKKLSCVGFDSLYICKFLKALHKKAKLRRPLLYLKFLFNLAKELSSVGWVWLASIAFLLPWARRSKEIVARQALPQGTKFFLDNLKDLVGIEVPVVQTIISPLNSATNDNLPVDPYIFSRYFQTIANKTDPAYYKLIRQMKKEGFGQESGILLQGGNPYTPEEVSRRLGIDLVLCDPLQFYSFHVWYYIVFYPFTRQYNKEGLTGWVEVCPYWTTMVGQLSELSPESLKDIWKQCSLVASDDVKKRDKALFPVRTWRLFRPYYHDIYYKRNELLKDKIEEQMPDLLSKKVPLVVINENQNVLSIYKRL